MKAESPKKIAQGKRSRHLVFLAQNFPSPESATEKIPHTCRSHEKFIAINTMTKADEFIQRAISWDDFVAGQRGQQIKEKGDTFERLVQLYLQLEPIYSAELKKSGCLQKSRSKFGPNYIFQSQILSFGLSALNSVNEVISQTACPP